MKEESTISTGETKPDAEQIERAVESEIPSADYSGAREKTDPVEIKLVRKMDMMILPMLAIMYFCNYLVREMTLCRLICAHIQKPLLTLEGPKCHYQRTT